jgi:hypothetical protein
MTLTLEESMNRRHKEEMLEYHANAANRAALQKELREQREWDRLYKENEKKTKTDVELAADKAQKQLWAREQQAAMDRHHAREMVVYHAKMDAAKKATAERHVQATLILAEQEKQRKNSTHQQNIACKIHNEIMERIRTPV